MSDFDYDAPAEVFAAKRAARSRSPLAYRRFTTAAEAIRYVIEGLSDARRIAAFMQVGDERFDSDAIRDLYDRADYPLSRGELHSN